MNFAPGINLFDRHFPAYGIRNISLYYLITLLSVSWFIIGNWLFFALNYVSAYQIGLIEAVSFGIGWLLEIPSGAIADLIGKKKTLQLALFMQTFGSILFLLAFISPWLLAIGNIIIISSFAFTSGSAEALAYDSMVEKGKEQHYDMVAGRVGTLVQITFVITALVGGILWRYSEFLPWMATILIFSLATIISFWLKEPEVDTYKFSWKQFKEQSIIGFSQLALPGIKPYLLILFTIAATYYMWSTGIIRIFMGADFGYDGETLSYLISGAALVSAVLSYNFDKIKNWIGNGGGLFLLAVLSLMGWLLAGFGGGLFLGLVAIVLITVAGDLSHPWRSTIINKHVPSKYRATTISTLQFMVQLPYVLAAMFFGMLVENQYQHYFYYAAGLLLAGALVLSYGAKARQRAGRVFQR